MKYVIIKARTTEERVAIYRFRYKVFIEEQQKHYIKADHTRQMLYDKADAYATLYYAQKDAEVIGTVRVMHGAEGDFMPSDIDFFSIDNYEKYYNHDELAIADKFMVAPAFRHTKLPFMLMMATLGGIGVGAKICFITCLDALLEMYLHFGFRTYTAPHIMENGMKRHKLVLHIDDMEYLEKTKSPIVNYLKPDFACCRYPATEERNLLSENATVGHAVC